jgi:DAACS family dicarboxylate/amino acid:cation (Na+ or H+) symporter
MAQKNLQRWILIGLVAGLSLGLALNLATADNPSARGVLETAVNEAIKPIGLIFLRLIFMTVMPLVFSALALGIHGLGDLKELGKIGARTLVLTLVLSGISVAFGLALVNVIDPGRGIPPEARERYLTGAGEEELKAVEEASRDARAFSLEKIVNTLLTRNPVESAAKAFEGDMLAVLVFALLFGVALRACGSKRVAPVVAFLEGLYDVSIWLIGLALRMAPLGVAALTFSMASLLGLPVLISLGSYVVTVLVGLGLMFFGVYPVVLKAFCGVSPIEFLTRIREVVLTAFSTSSSNATLPTTLRVAKSGLGMPAKVADFVLTLGSTFNQNGTALFEGVTILFLAQFFGVDLGLGQQAMVILLSVLAGVGTAGVPGGSIPVIVPILISVGIPGEGILVILGVDRLLDMCRTVLNVSGDLVVASCVAKQGGWSLPAEESNQPLSP